MIFFLIVLALISIKPYLNNNFPYTHDGENHLARFANYKIAIREGQFPPRFAPNLVNHYGYPVFNYNYPLANIISLPFSFLKINYELTFKIIVYSFILLGLIGVNLWLKKLKFKKQPRIFSLTLFALTPYLISSISYRGNIGEIMSFCLLPWLFYFIENPAKNILKKDNFKFLGQTFLWILFFLSHNIAVLFGTPILIIYAILKYQKKIFKQIPIIFSFVLGIISTLWFWLPAVFEKNLVVLDEANLSKSYLEHFPTLSQLLFSPLEFGFSKIGSIDSLSFQIGLAQIFILIFAFILIKKKKVTSYIKLLFVASLLLFLFQLGITKPLWKVIPLVNFIQFPWRLNLFLGILILPIGAYLFSQNNKLIKIILSTLIIIQLVITLRVKPADYFHKNNIDYEAFSQTTSTANENLPKTFLYSNFADWAPTAKILSGGEGIITTHQWRGSKRTYSLKLSTESIIVEPTMYFKGWETKISGQEINNEKISYIDNKEIKGRIAYQLGPGEYKVTSKFTQNTLPRVIGNALSGLGIFIITLLILLIILPKNELKKLTILFYIWRSFLFLIGYLANVFLKYKPSFPYSANLTSYQLPQWLYSWANFDGVHYLTIVKKGYFGTGLIQAFFPLFPLVIKFLNLTHNPLITGLIISTLLSYILIISFYLFTKIFLKKDTYLPLLILLTFPTSFFFGAFYTESLFLILVFLTFIMSNKKKWLWAGIFAGLASATRVIGILLVPALIIEYLLEDKKIEEVIRELRNKKARLILFNKVKTKIIKKNYKLLLILLGSFGLVSYMSYLWLRFNDPFYFFHVQAEFGGGRQESLISYPQVLYRYIKILITARPFDFKYFAYLQEFIAGTIGLILLIIASKKIKLSHLFFTLGAFFIPTLTGTFSSMPRYLLICWPIFFVIADLLKNKKLRYLYFIISTIFLTINTILFIQGYWVA